MKSLQVQEGGSHYKDMAIQPIQFILANGIHFIEGSVIKYVARWKNKGGVADLKKARHLLNILIELEEAREAPPAALGGSGVLGAWVARHGPPGAPMAIEKAYDSMGRECVHGR